jgi:hypothetical protein
MPLAVELRAWKDIRTPLAPSDLTTHYHRRLVPTNKTTHNVLAEAYFEASNEIEGSHEEPGRGFKANIRSFLSNHFPCKSDRHATHAGGLQLTVYNRA